MRVPERPVRHERIIEVLRIHGVSFQSRKLRELCLHQMRIRISIRTIEEVYKMRWHTNSAGSQGSVDSGGIPQSLTPNIGGGWRRARIRDSSSWNLSAGTAWLEEGDMSIETSGSRDEGPAIRDWSSWTISSEMWARIWFLWAIAGRRIMTWAFVIRWPEHVQAVDNEGI